MESPTLLPSLLHCSWSSPSKSAACVGFSLPHPLDFTRTRRAAGWSQAGPAECQQARAGRACPVCPLPLPWPQSQKCTALGRLGFLLTRWEPGKQCQNQLCLQVLAETMPRKLSPAFPNLYLSFRSRGLVQGPLTTPFPAHLPIPGPCPASIAPSPTCDRTVLCFHTCPCPRGSAALGSCLHPPAQCSPKVPGFSWVV